MNRFWATAAELLKSNAKVAMFVIYRELIHPAIPHAIEAQQILNKLGHETLGPLTLRREVLVVKNYRRLPMPRYVDPEVEAFD